MKLKKILASTCLLVGLSSLGFTAFAGANVSLSFNSYDRNQGFVDGSRNGVYYSLSNGNHSLSVSSKSGSGNINVILRRDNLGIDPIIGTASVSSSGVYSLGNGPAADDYYIYASGTVANTNYSLSGDLN